MIVDELVYPIDSDLLPVIDGDVYRELANDREWQADEIVRCGLEPWYFVSNYVRTVRRDEGGSYVEPVPAKEYLQVALDDFVRYPRVAIGKSRQLMITWLAMAFTLWWGMWHDNAMIFCQQKKEEDADLEMIQRCLFIWRNLPVWMRNYSPLRYSYGELKFDKTMSLIKAIPSGGDQIRSHNPNILISDEIAFQERADESYTNALACCQRIILISTPGAGFFCDLVHDKVS